MALAAIRCHSPKSLSVVTHPKIKARFYPAASNVTSLLLIVATAISASSLTAQPVPPGEFLGYELGERFTPHHRVVDYVQHVADNSPNVVVSRYGATYEARPLLLAYVTSPQNHARLESIRRHNLARAGLPGRDDASDAGDADNDIAIVWLSYNVHGNESVSTEAAMMTLHALADPDNAQTQAWLENTVVILDPCINPDGRDRYVNWYNRTAGAFVNANPDDWTHAEQWPGGRTNHYFFDLNRDWAWASQQETRDRLAVYNTWMPHVHVDFHEQGVNDPYYFAPAAVPYHDAITEWQIDFQTQIGRNHARYFDQNNWLYFTKERFDLFYPGYGDTWPTYNGAIGMTYEQGGSGRAGIAIRTAVGDTLTLADRILHHHTTGLSTIEVSSAEAARVVDEFTAYFQTRTGNTRNARSYVLRVADAPDRAAAISDHLTMQGIRYSVVSESARVNGRAYSSGAARRFDLAAGDLVVSTNQPKGTLASVLFEPESLLSDSLTYDITSWSLPYLYGVEAVLIEGGTSIPTVTAPTGDLRAGSVTGNAAKPYAYLSPLESVADQRFLASLLAKGIRVRMVHEELQLDGRSFPRGTVVITRADNLRMGGRFDETVRALVEHHGRSIHSTATGFASAGPDLGSGKVSPVPAPKVLLLTGSSVSSSSFGQAWHYFDETIAYPVTIVNGEDLGGVDLDDYNVIVLPSGFYREVLSSEALTRVRTWVREGGKLIALDAGARFLAGKEGFGLTMVSTGSDDHDEASADSASGERPAVQYADRERRSASGRVVGAFYAAAIDRTHPLGYGLPASVPMLRRTATVAKRLDGGWNVGVISDGRPMSGFAGFRTDERLDESLALGVEDMGRGEVIYIMDDPLFRGMWYTGAQVFGNAVFAVGTD